MANSALRQDSESLLQTLNDLMQTSQEDNNCISFKTFNCKSGYVIYHVPPHFKHPLRNIVNSVENSFFLVSKLPSTLSKILDESIEQDTKADNINQQVELTLPITTHQCVLVGTPISQKLYHLFQQKDLHARKAETIEKHMDLSSLEKLELKYARYFLSLYSCCVQLQKDLPEVWLVCDRSNHQGVTHMGMKPCVTPDSNLSEKSAHKISTVLVRSQNFNTSKKDGINISEEKKRHMTFHRASHAETHGYARYNIYGSPESFGNDAGQPGSSITMEFAWDGTREILQPPPPSSNAVLNICAHPEDARNILSSITSELNSLINHFAVVQGISCEPELVTEEVEHNNQELEEKILAFLDDLKSNSFGAREAKEETVSTSPTSNLAAPFGVGEAITRQDLDNTECMWLFLKDFTSSGKIAFCLKVIFSALFEGQYQPVLYSTNQTQIGKLIKEVFCCNTDQEKAAVRAKITHTFSTCAAMQSLVDIGLEKLRNDYTHYFIKQELVTMDKLDYYLARDVPVTERVQRLLRFHCILSLVAMAISYAHITYDDLRELVGAALKFYEEHNHTEHPVFSLSLPAYSASSSTVKNVCVRQFHPQTWMASITTMNKYTTIIKMEAGDQSGSTLESFIEHEKSVRGNSYLASIATVSQVCI